MTRYEFQAVLIGLDAPTRAQVITFMTNALAGKKVRVGTDPVVREQSLHETPVQVLAVVVEVSFETSLDGQNLFDSATAKAQQIGATNSPSPWLGEQSTIWMKEVDDVAGTITIRQSQSPTWTVVSSVVPLRTG
jgi:hypothetical protein